MSGRQADYVAYVEGRLGWLRRLAYLLCRDWHTADDLVQATVTVAGAGRMWRVTVCTRGSGPSRVMGGSRRGGRDPAGLMPS